MPDTAQLHPLIGRSPREPWRWPLFAFAFYLLLALYFTWPLALHFGDSVIQKGGVPVDAGQGVWNLWWARSALLAGQNPFPTQFLFYPLDVNLFYQTLSLPNALLVFPILFAYGPVAAFNAVTLLSFGLGGLWMYQVARRLIADRPAALLAGAIFVFTPYHIQRLWSGPMELIAVQWLPLYLLLLMRALERRTFPAVLAAALALLITTLASQYYGLYAAVFTGLYVLLASLLAAPATRGALFLSGTAVGVAWVLLLLPFVFAAGGLGGVALEDWYERQVYHSVALVDLITPNIRHPLWGAAAESAQAALHPFGLEAGAAPGLVVYALCALAFWRVRRLAWPWLLLALITLLLAMGPQLRATEAFTPIPGPFLILDLVGPFRNSSRPAIFIVLTMLAVALAAALAVAELRAGLAAQRRRALTALLSIFLLFESLLRPWPLTPLRAAPYTAQLSADPLPGAVLNLPPQNNDSVALINQICHGRPMLGGYLARLPAYPWASYPSAVQRLWDAEPPAPEMFDAPTGAQLAALGVRFVTLDLTQLPRAQAARLREQLAVSGVTQVFADPQAEVYAVDPLVARPTLLLGPGWYDREQSAERVWRWMQAQAEVQVQMPQSGPVELSFVATAYEAARPLRIQLGPALLQEVEIPPSPFEQVVVLRLLLPAGANTLTLSSPAAISPEGRTLSLSIERLQVQAFSTSAAYRPQPAAQPPAAIPRLAAAPCNQ